MVSTNVQPERDYRQLLKLATEFGPLAVFFLANANYGLFVATGAFMAATALALIGSKVFLNRIPVMLLVTSAVVFVFGGLTLWLQNDIFIKLKPTIVNLTFATLLLGGLWFNKAPLRYLFGDAFSLDETGWRILTLRWGVFFVALAILNEIVWRNFSTNQWVFFKTFGILPLSIVFALFQIKVILKHQLQPEVAISKN